MTADIVTSVLVGLAVLTGCLGIIIPVLPGSILIAIAVLIWALVVGTTSGWVVFAIVMVFVAVGMTSSWVLTGSRLKARSIPNRSLVIGALVAAVGFFVVPVIGLLLGFVVGLYLAEYARLRDAKIAWESSWTAIKAAGVGIIVEFTCAAVAAGVYAVGVLVHFL